MGYNMKINDDFIKNANKCKKDHSCLSGDATSLCKIEFCIEDKVHLSNVLMKIHAITEYHSGILMCAPVLSGKSYIIGIRSDTFRIGEF